jgi:hypothetical protein
MKGRSEYCPLLNKTGISRASCTHLSNGYLLESLKRVRRSDRPVLGNVNGRRLIARQLALRSTVVVVERVGFLIILAGSVSQFLSRLLVLARATHKFYPRGMFRWPVSGLIFSQLVASNRLEAACPLVEGLATALRHLVLGPPAEVEGSEHGNVDAEAGEHQLDAAEHEGREGGAGQVADEVDDIDLPEADDSDDDAPTCC